MLKRLTIRNLAIIPEAVVHFEDGFNVLTGETGAGKSILVDAISLLAGGRASVGDVRSGEESAAVEAEIELPSNSGIGQVLSEMGIVRGSDELILRRTIGADGRSRAYVNEQSLTVSALAALAPFWVDLNGQHSQQQLLNEEFHLDLLDEYGKCIALRKEYEQQFERLRECTRELENFKLQRERAKVEKDFLTFQLSELKKTDPKQGELEELESLHSRLKNGAQLAQFAVAADAELSGENGALEKLGRLESMIRAAEKYDPTLGNWRENLLASIALLNHLASDLSAFSRSLEFEPEEVDRVNLRMAELQALKRKYGSLEKALVEKERIDTLLRAVENSAGDENRMEAEIEMLRKSLGQAGSRLSKIRHPAADKLSAQVSSELKPLGMGSAEVKVTLEKTSEADGLGPHGLEIAKISFAPNPGEGFRPLTKIVSGGELSRVMLAIKSVAMSDEGVRGKTYLFDEADAGIGGQTAERVGLKMKGLARMGQVLCVTHLAQIACYADTHLQVEKAVTRGRTTANVKVLSDPGKAEEIARMIGGLKISETALTHASELLGRGKSTKGARL